jgi:predicted phosphodiesterase
MKTAIISDIHSNKEALLKALEVIDKEKPDEIICGGDIVGYASEPKECLKLLKKRKIKSIKGNHEDALINKEHLDSFNDHAKKAIFWTKKQLNKKAQNYLAELPLTISANDFVLTHSGLYEPDEWHYITTIDEAEASFKLLNKKICFFGHTHVPGIFDSKGTYKPITEGVYSLANIKKCMINVGSIGQPRDRDTRACFVIYDSEKQEVTFFRVAYNLKKTQTKILKAGLPVFLSERLESGQ